MYLDCDTTPPLRSRWVRGRLTASVNAAKKLLADASDGQVGLYESAAGNGFAGYVIKYPGEAPYFEAADADDAS